MTQTPHSDSFTTQPLEAQAQQQATSQQRTAPQPAISAPPEPVTVGSLLKLPLKRKSTRIIAIIITLALVVALYLIWHTPASTTSLPGITQHNFSGTSSNSSGSTGSSTTTGADIHVYVVGAIKHPGVYSLPSGARVYQLLQAAGGALPNANLVALNLAAQLSDGEEVYVLANGETPPTYIGGVPGPGASGTATAGQLVNINTASADEMRQSLHISSTTAQNIVNYRLQHGPYTSIDQLQQVVSKSVYDKIKDLITI
jgi:competence protein ComEA